MERASVFTDIVIGVDEARVTLRREHVAELCRGHFPEEPLVPGAMLVGIMAEVASLALGDPVRAPAEVERAVFLARVAPQEGIVVTATRHGERVDAEVRVGGTPAARGVFNFGNPA
jgi:3-hydroxymyristoyl/3-hydroxydecanoyl-(acyl carrier protein) dehydratase